MEENLIFDTIPIKFCAMVEEYRLELAKKNPIELQLDVSLAWWTICWIHETVLISKKFWFIKRLVEQNKIDDSKVWNSDMLSVQYNVLVNDYKYEWLIMILSISENPISDLISYLK